jgi:hypothetical protein
MRVMMCVLTIALFMRPISSFAQRPAAPLEPSLPSQIVTLQTAETPCPVEDATTLWLADVQTLPDGTTARFTGIPPGKVLIATGLSFVVTRVSDLTANNTTQVLLFLVPRVPPTSGLQVPRLFHTGVQVPGVAGSRAGVSAALHNAVIKPDTSLCLGHETGFFVTAIISGFLTEDK